MQFLTAILQLSNPSSMRRSLLLPLFALMLDMILTAFVMFETILMLRAAVPLGIVLLVLLELIACLLVFALLGADEPDTDIWAVEPTAATPIGEHQGAPRLCNGGDLMRS